MRRLAKNLILATTVSAIFIVDLSFAGAASLPYEKIYLAEKNCPLFTDNSKQYLDFWSKFRDTVMPDEPQNNNPPKDMEKPKPTEKPNPPPSDEESTTKD